jgi:hypothetical protein
MGERMSNGAPLTEAEIEQLAIEWYHLLDVHAPLDELRPLLADDDLVFQFPEGPAYKQAGFAQWYDRVTRIFFDEVHTVTSVKATPAGDHDDVKVNVNWQAHIWNPPDAKSQWIGFDAAQTWTVRRSPETGKAIIVTYVVDALTPMPGSPDL